MQTYLPLVALTLLTVACSGGLGSPGPDDEKLDDDGTVVVIDPVTGKPVVVDKPAGGSSSDGGGGGTGTGGPNDPDHATGGAGTDPGSDPSVPATPLSDCDTPGPRLIRRLTGRQYENTLKDLLGDGIPVEEVLSDPAVHGFHVDADAARVTDLTAELLMSYAERVTASTMESEPWKLANCNNHDAGCHEQVIREFGRRAFRADVTPEQMQTYLELFAGESSFEAGLHVVVSTMLQSPYLLYRRELGEPDPSAPGRYRLTPYEVASELSYMLTDSPPNAQLLDRAAQGRLSTREDIDQAAHELLGQEKAKQGLAEFVHGWLEVDNLFKKAKSTELFELTDPLRQAMLDETSQFFLEIFNSGGTIGDLYGADFTMLNQPLAAFYGLDGAHSPDSFTRVALDGRRPSGVLGHASLLTQHSLPDNSSPVQRGVVVRERILCQELPPVPENLDTSLDESGTFVNNRDRYQKHSADPGCRKCHQSMDPIGFAFEEYDAFGRYRQEEGGLPVDASGELDGVVGGPVILDGVQSLNDYLARSDEARSCLIEYWSYYAYGRTDWPAHECNHDSIRAEAAQGGYTLKDTLLSIIHAPHFTSRVADAPNAD